MRVGLSTRQALEYAANQFEQQLARERAALAKHIEERTTEIALLEQVVGAIRAEAEEIGGSETQKKGPTDPRLGRKPQASVSNAIQTLASCLLRLHGGEMKTKDLHRKLAELEMFSRDPGQLIRKALMRGSRVVRDGEVYRLSEGQDAL
jgi:hypothetical protein